MSPNAPRTQARQVRVNDDRWENSRKAADADGTDRAKVINEFLAWYSSEPGAKMPKRPKREAWDK